MKTIVVIQARLSSSRLPAKVLLPIKSISMVVLAAKRAANQGREVIVVTSIEQSDDLLCEELNKNDVSYYRGSLNNTLSRFVSALKAFDDETVVFRLTADNVFPDGELLDEIEDYFLSGGYSYLACNGESSGVPYGLSVEVMELASLREANANTNEQFDLEHVTPYIRRKHGEAYFDKYKELNAGMLRCTVDSLDDYISVYRVFSDVENPISVSWKELLVRLKKESENVLVKSPVSKLVFGAAQLGLNYGINNKSGQPSQDLSDRIIKKAIVNGVGFIDTARAYGDSEYVLGNILQKGWESRVQAITKLSPLTSCGTVDFDYEIKIHVKASVYESCVRLRTSQIFCLMLHRVEHLQGWNGAVWDELLGFKESGLVKSLGVSVQSPEELELALSFKDVEFIQMPYNLLDSRWDDTIKKIKAVKKERRLFVHVRSSLLQGLLSTSDKRLWNKANVVDPSSVMSFLEQKTTKFKLNSIVELCLKYVKSQGWVDGVVVGMESEAQLDENLKIFSSKNLSLDELVEINRDRPILSAKTLNPANWIV